MPMIRSTTAQEDFLIGKLAARGVAATTIRSEHLPHLSLSTVQRRAKEAPYRDVFDVLKRLEAFAETVDFLSDLIEGSFAINPERAAAIATAFAIREGLTLSSEFMELYDANDQQEREKIDAVDWAEKLGLDRSVGGPVAPGTVFMV